MGVKEEVVLAEASEGGRGPSREGRLECLREWMDDLRDKPRFRRIYIPRASVIMAATTPTAAPTAAPRATADFD